MSDSDLFELHLLGLSDEDWEVYAADNGLSFVVRQDPNDPVQIHEDGTVEITDEKMAESVRQFKERIAQRLAEASKAIAAVEESDDGD